MQATSQCLPLGSVQEGEAVPLPPLTARRSAILETIVFLSALIILNKMFGDGTRFIDMALHPFWIIVLLVTLQYGIGEALACALLCSVFLLVGNLPEQNLTETMYDYVLRVTFLPFMWIVTALVLGSVRTRQRVEKQRLLERLKTSEEATRTIVKGYQSMKHAKEQLELRLAEERRSVLTVYNVAKSLEATDAIEAEAAVAELVRAAFNPPKFSIFRWEGGQFKLESAHGWKDGDAYTRKFAPNTKLARALLEKKRVLSIVNEGDEVLLGSEGVLAGPIWDERSDRLFGMLKIEEIGFMDLGIRTHETLRIVCEWIARVYANVEKFQVQAAAKAPEPAREEPRLPIAFQRHYLTSLAQRQGFSLFEIAIRASSRDHMTASQRQHATLLMRKLLHEQLRTTDLLFTGSDDSFALFVSCYDEADLQLIVTKLQMAVIRQGDKVLTAAQYAYDVKTLHVAETVTRQPFPLRHTPQIAV